MLKLESPGHPFCVRSAPERDPRGHMISIVYVGRGYGTLKAGDDAKTVRLYTPHEVKALFGTGKLAFDHEDILREYLTRRHGMT